MTDVFSVLRCAPSLTLAVSDVCAWNSANIGRHRQCTSNCWMCTQILFCSAIWFVLDGQPTVRQRHDKCECLGKCTSSKLAEIAKEAFVGRRGSPNERSCQWTESGPSIWCPEKPCFKDYRTWKDGTVCCLSLVNSMDLHQPFCGRTRWEPSTTNSRVKVVSRNPLMPLLFALGQHFALVAVSERLHVGKLLFAFHDDLYVKSSPGQGQWNVPTFCVKSFGSIAGYRSTTGKLACGTELVYSPEIVRSWKTLPGWLIRTQLCGRETKTCP